MTKWLQYALRKMNIFKLDLFNVNFEIVTLHDFLVQLHIYNSLIEFNSIGNFKNEMAILHCNTMTLSNGIRSMSHTFNIATGAHLHLHQTRSLSMTRLTTIRIEIASFESHLLAFGSHNCAQVQHTMTSTLTRA